MSPTTTPTASRRPSRSTYRYTPRSPDLEPHARSPALRNHDPSSPTTARKTSLRASASTPRCTPPAPRTASPTWFGLKGAGPPTAGDSSATPPPQPGAYINAHRAEWKALATKHGLKIGVMDVELGEGKGGYQYFIITLFDFDRHPDLGGMREVGFQESVKGDASWAVAFERFQKGGRFRDCDFDSALLPFSY
jgi:hypothetical protein